MNKKHYDLIFKAGIISLLVFWIALVVSAAIFISVVWVKVVVIALLVLVPIIVFVVWIFKNYSGPQ